MAYRVSFTTPAKTDTYIGFERIREVSPKRAERWLEGLFGAVFSLEEMPFLFPVIPEAGEFAYTLRHLLYGKGNGVYRIIFRILEPEQHVHILRIWHASRNAIIATDVEH